MKMKVRIDGIAKIDRNLVAMSRALARKTLKPIMREALKPMAEDMRGNVAQGTGELAKSIRVSDRLSKRQRKLNERVAPIEMYVGPGALPQAVQEEFGNVRQAPRPYIRPAFDRGAPEAVREVAQKGVDAILAAGKKS